MSILVIFGQTTKVIALVFWQKSLISLTCQSEIKINQFQFLVIFGQNTKVIALLFGQTSLIVITFQSAIKVNQIQFWSFLAKIPRLQPYFLAKNRSFSSPVNLQSKSINFNFGHCWPKYQGYSLTVRPNIAHFHHFSICNQNQSISILVNFSQITKVIGLLYGQKTIIFITCQSAIKINQFQFWSFLAKLPRLQPYFSAKHRSFSSPFNLQSKSINFNVGQFWPNYQGYSLTVRPKLAHFHHFSICNQNQSISILVNFGQNTKVIALLFGQKSLIFITCQSAIKINQCQFWSFLAKLPRLQPQFFGKNRSFLSLVNLKSKSINFTFWSFVAKIPRLQPYFLAKHRSLSSLFNLQSK